MNQLRSDLSNSRRHSQEKPTPFIRLAMAVICIHLLAVEAVSAAPLPELRKGMAPKEVIKLWGPPKERMEYETKREELWVYDTSEVRWRSGKVFSWKKKGPSGSMISSAQEGYDSGQFADDELTDEAPVPVSDILSEIMQEGSDEDDDSKRNRRRRR